MLGNVLFNVLVNPYGWKLGLPMCWAIASVQSGVDHGGREVALG